MMGFKHVAQPDLYCYPLVGPRTRWHLTRVQTFREDDHQAAPKKSSRLALLRSRIASFRKSRNASLDIATPPAHSQETRSVFAPTAHHLENQSSSAPVMLDKRSGQTLFKNIFSRKRERSPTPTPLSIQEPVKLKFLFVGDHASGQTALLYRTTFGYFPDDTSGAGDLNIVSRLSYMVWDAVFLCFDVKERMGLLKVLSWWQHAVDTDFCANSEPLIYLLGLKKDLRMECSFEDHRLAMGTGLTLGLPSCCVNPRDADWHARRIGAERFTECSALTGDGVETLLEEAGGVAVRRNLGSEGGKVMERAVRRRLA
ncbi:hypothetical protein C2857_006595 [Epichloe festucae Fl1]|uniref:Uncharacterized protein n=1 Tax=Epichloe festucae (strain Fl1) TaxID=877507 RepID=A0A7S9KQ60_EPIFF|nr:hypothetical protein C2857_006595 [Epichloe festucae Fl1]